MNKKIILASKSEVRKKILEQNNINCIALSLNPNAIDILKENPHKIDWDWLSANPSIFEDEPMPTI